MGTHTCSHLAHTLPRMRTPAKLLPSPSSEAYLGRWVPDRNGEAHTWLGVLQSNPHCHPVSCTPQPNTGQMRPQDVASIPLPSCPHQKPRRGYMPLPGLNPQSGLARGSAQSQRAPDRVLCHCRQQQGLAGAARGSVPRPRCHCGAGRADWPGPPELEVCVEEAEGEAPWTWTGLCIFAALFLLSVSYSAILTLLMAQRFPSAPRQGRPRTSHDYANILQPHT
ncbi:uncharacterized protein LOC116542594 [Sapajus apella]|uniref:Uncharacterized protein LOC116542594 n=1 Tax=Sapajus apella TaxID=9515 RepID=A0A6J3GZ01_SAPAP|nr:uncharacterized protein LOC116542594 [Sapajus apella]